MRGMKPLLKRLAPTGHPTLKDICWAAGFWEGDGTCRWGSRVAITQKDPEKLRWMKARFGGTISDQVPGNTRFKKHDSYYQWCIHGARARGFMLTIYSMCSKRNKRRIKLALQSKRKGGM